MHQNTGYTKCLILLGSNLGNRLQNLANAIENIQHLNDTKVIMKSRIYETEPWGFIEQPWFLNQVIEVKTAFEARHLFEMLMQIEKELGRDRSGNLQWQSRAIDIDLLLYGDQIINSPELTIPHPLLEKRRFALVPLAEIAGELIHPLQTKTINELLQICKDNSEVRIFVEP